MNVVSAVGAAQTVEEHWDDLVTAALLGTDRRDPPPPVDALADLVADTARASPSERMLAQVAACTAVRRAAFLPGPPLGVLPPADTDPRPVCSPTATDRWHHIVVSWPVLEDEWTIMLIRNGWRAAPELAPALLRRHRGDPVRRARAIVAVGAVAEWLVDLVPALHATRVPSAADVEAIDVLPELPIPPDLAELRLQPGDEIGRALASGLHGGDLAHAHRGVLVNLLARVEPDALHAIAVELERLGMSSPGYGNAQLLADLARTRQRMLAELTPISCSLCAHIARTVHELVDLQRV